MVITYDIADDRRRAGVHKVLEDYGQWVQFSVFECRLTPARWKKLRQRLTHLISHREDSLRFYPLCAGCREKIDYVGGPAPLPPPEAARLI